MFSKRLGRKPAIQILSGLVLVFCFRVGAQFLQSIGDFDFLPSFSEWHSDSIPYLWLFLSQVIIIFFTVTIIFKLHRNTYKCDLKKAKVLLFIGWLYFIFMWARFLLSMTLMQSHPWFGATLPAVFHMVLASFLIVLGWYESGHVASRNDQL